MAQCALNNSNCACRSSKFNWATGTRFSSGLGDAYISKKLLNSDCGTAGRAGFFNYVNNVNNNTRALQNTSGHPPSQKPHAPKPGRDVLSRPPVLTKHWVN